jgi:hypothetical protein
MLGVDRLDMIKGIPQKLLAFEKFLQEHEEWRDKVLLVQVSKMGLGRRACFVASCHVCQQGTSACKVTLGCVWKTKCFTR